MAVEEEMTDMQSIPASSREPRPGPPARLPRFCAALALTLLLAWGLFAALTLPVRAAPALAPTATPIAPSHVVISEFRTRGPAGTSDEFIELFNPTGASIDIGGWIVKKSSGCGTTSTNLVVVPASTNLLPGQHYLIANAAVGSMSPTPNMTYPDTTTNRLADNGGVAIFDSSSLIVDAVGLCSTTLYLEGSPVAPTISSGILNKSYERFPGGAAGSCYDTNDNSIDFQIITPSDPQNSSSPFTYCAGVQTVTPTETATETATPTTTHSPTVTQTPIITLSPTITPTPTLTLTRSLTPIITLTQPFHKIVINEVAWAGTNASSSDEWIEFYNPGPSPVDLNGWVLDDWNLTQSTHHWTITLTGSIPGRGYYLLANDAGVIIDVKIDQADGRISLLNSGDILKLSDPTENLVDTANRAGGAWPAGSSSPSLKCSMERSSPTVSDDPIGWFTNNNVVRNGHDAAGKPICGTPKKENWAYSVTVTPTKTPTRTRTPTITRTPSKTRTPTKTRVPTKTMTPTPAPMVVSSVVINEFLTQPRSDWNQDGVVDSGDSFIEIKNLSTISVAVTGWWLDDQEGDSSPYTLPALTLEPGAWKAYFASETHISLSNAGDSVRLFKPGAISDVFTYGVIKTPGQSWCRFPDGGQDAWTFGCEPTPNQTNKLAPSIFVAVQSEPVMCQSKTILPAVYQAECASAGLDIWSPQYWSGELQSGYPLYIQRDEELDVME